MSVALQPILAQSSWLFFGIGLITGVAIFKDQGDITKRLLLVKLVDKELMCFSNMCVTHVLNPLYEQFQCVYQVCGMSETFLNMLCINAL